MRRQHTGRGTPVIPDSWVAAPAGIVAATLDATVTIGPATGGPDAWNPSTQQVEATPGTPVYTGPAQMTPVTDNDRPTISADDPVTVRTYRVTLPAATTGITVGHLLTVTDSTDPMLEGRALVVDSVERGGRRFSRTVFAHLTDD